MAHPERIVPDETVPGIVALHLKRYEFAAPLSHGRKVLDAACGVGYGTAFLAESAESVVGVDLSEEAVSYARRRYGGPNIEFLVMDVTRLTFDDESFDVVCCFETIEHLDDPARAVAEAARVLRPGGTYVLSTPHVAQTTRTPENPFHRVEFAREDFEQLLRAHFEEVELYGQRRLETRRHRLAKRLDVFGLRRVVRLPLGTRILGTAATAEVTAADVVISPTGLEGSSELVAICRWPRRRA